VTTAKKSRPKKPIADGRPLSPAQIAEAIRLYELGDVTMEDLAKRYKKSRRTFARIFSERGVKKGSASAEHAARVAEAVDAAALSDVAITAKRIKDSREQSYKLGDMMQKLVGLRVKQAREKGEDLALSRPFFQSIQDASKAIQIGQTIMNEALGLNDEKQESDEIPELEIREMTADQIEGAKKGQQMEEGLDGLLGEIEEELDDDDTPGTDQEAPGSTID
jgi:AraC-like DNA-binding protein